MPSSRASRRPRRNRQPDRARPRPHVDDPRPPHPLLAQVLQRRLDQQLALGPRDQHVGRDVDVELVELPMPRDVGHRLPLQSPRDGRLERRLRLRRQHVLQVRVEARPRAIAEVAQQHLRLEARIVDARVVQLRRRRDPDVADRRRAHRPTSSDAVSRPAASKRSRIRAICRRIGSEASLTAPRVYGPPRRRPAAAYPDSPARGGAAPFGTSYAGRGVTMISS